MDSKYLAFMIVAVVGISYLTLGPHELVYADAQNNCRSYFGYNSSYTCTRAELCQAQFDRVCTCVETQSCNITGQGQFLPGLISIFDYPFGGMTLIIFWGLMIGIIWIRTQNPAMVALIGVVIVAGYLAALEDSGEEAPIEFEQARTVGVILLVLSIGIGVYQLVSTRIFQPAT